MPTRMIRDGLLDSQRYWSVGVEARLLFIHLLLLADDFGLVSLDPVFVRRRCFGVRAPSQSKVDGLIEQLAGADLIRIYYAGPSDAPSKIAFIPKFGQRMRTVRARHALPPLPLYEDDKTAQKLFHKNKALFENLPASRRQPDDRLRPEVEVEVKGNEVEVKGSEVEVEVPLATLAGAPSASLPGGAGQDPVQSEPANSNPAGKISDADPHWEADLAEGRQLGIEPLAHEKRIEFRKRLSIARRRAAQRAAA